MFVRDYSNPNKASWQEATVKKRIGSQSYSCVLARSKKLIKRHVNQMIIGKDEEKVDEIEQAALSIAINQDVTKTDNSVLEGGRLEDNAHLDPTDLNSRNLRRLQRRNYKE